jgi:ribosomal protein L20
MNILFARQEPAAAPARKEEDFCGGAFICLKARIEIGQVGARKREGFLEQAEGFLERAERNFERTEGDFEQAEGYFEHRERNFDHREGNFDRAERVKGQAERIDAGREGDAEQEARKQEFWEGEKDGFVEFFWGGHRMSIFF